MSVIKKNNLKKKIYVLLFCCSNFIKQSKWITTYQTNTQYILNKYLKKKIIVEKKKIKKIRVVKNKKIRILKKKYIKFRIVKKKKVFLFSYLKFKNFLSYKKYNYKIQNKGVNSKIKNFFSIINFEGIKKKFFFNFKSYSLKYFFKNLKFKRLVFNNLKINFYKKINQEKKPFFWNNIFLRRKRFGSIYSKLKFKFLLQKFRYKRVKNNFFIKLLKDKKFLFFTENFVFKKKNKIKYIKSIYYKEFKWRIFKFQYNKIRNFLRFTKFYKLVFRKIKKKKSLYPVISRLYEFGQFGKPKTKVREFILTRRSLKDGITYWFGFSHRWLRNSVLQHKISKFYFSPLRFKKTIITKKLKYLRIYKRLFAMHPRIGKWVTVGLVGNSLARNMIYLKKKVLLKIFSNLYYTKHSKSFKMQSKKYKTIFSKFQGFLNTILNFFESRLDVIILRSSFTPLIFLARILVKKGYIDVNFQKKINIYYRTKNKDFISINWKIRNTIFEIRWERFEVFQNLYLFRNFKAPFFNIISLYVAQILSSVAQKQERNFWFQSLSEVKVLIEEYNVGLPIMSLKQINNMQINPQINPIYRFDKEIKKIPLSLSLNWNWLRNENKILSNTSIKALQFLAKFKHKTLKRFYTKSIFEKLLNKINKKLPHKYFVQIQVLKQIIKDLLVQTWQNFPKNIIVNLALRFIYVISKITINTIKKYDTFSFYSILNINYLHWFLQNI